MGIWLSDRHAMPQTTIQRALVKETCVRRVAFVRSSGRESYPKLSHRDDIGLLPLGKNDRPEQTRISKARRTRPAHLADAGR